MEKWAKEMAVRILANESVKKKEEKARNKKETQEAQQAAADKKTRLQEVGVKWKELKTQIKNHVGIVNKEAGKKVLSTDAKLSYSMRVLLVSGNRAINLTVKEATGIVSCEGFNGGEFDLRDIQFNAEQKARTLVERLVGAQ